ncbi:P-loop containing nucleoside triphosphate hydrolase protein [Coniophora puteana RWD-64-598 SS2]|uniref:Origin recognition complex subunit 1 n=1 Tax=Coniophora puteana (strain RWD-64-598) TaxID=741705 RepID=A0A5M3MZS7_CONPW|nr:P-loop containing nucleoside triphosphate hydrolase protein [Coniophora puteana RWD-64-598 SS2]EIW84536.1 P-loop containing nucleoside triphosphate hydrolase protein [Coniophora puteana RWD-64-598 SS2]
MAVPDPTTPRRRSSRFQPVVTPSRHHDSSDAHGSSVYDVRLDRPYHTRVVRPSDLPGGAEWDEDKYQGYHVEFCTEARRRKQQRNKPNSTVQLRNASAHAQGWDLDSDDEHRVEMEVKEDLEGDDTPRKTRLSARVRRKDEGRKEIEGELETFRVGDTVLVETAHKLPSIAVITSIWALINPSRPKEKDVVIKLHWFLRPMQLPTVRAKRIHEPAPNEVYFTLSATASVSPSSLLTHCIVSASPPPSKPSKPTSSRVPRKPQDKPDEYFCQFAVDNTRGLFYTFDWDAHRAHALVAALAHGKTEKAEEEGTEERTNGSRWSVEVKTVRPRRPRDEAGARSLSRSPGPRKRRRLNTIKEADEDAYGSEQGDGAESEAPTESDVAPSDSEDDDEAEVDEEQEDDDDDLDLLRTPSKRKRSRPPSSPTKRTPSKTKTSTTPKSTPRTPRKSRTHIAAPTPYSKAALRARARAQGQGRKHRERDPGDARGAQGYYTAADLSNVPPDPWLRAQQALHVAARPGALPCRDEEFGKIMRAVEGLVEEGSGGCVYISGVPGTGKTATVHAVVRELKRRAENNESNPFTYVEINGLRVPEPAAAYTQLWTTLSADSDASTRISSKEALKRLHRHFAAGGAAGPRCATVVLMDELDQLVTAKQDVVYNFFNWPTIAGSKLVVLAVANTMDLPERVMSGRVRSRLGMSRINFQPYKREQLVSIIESRLALAAASLTDAKDASLSTTAVLSADAIRFASSKTASISGDARRVLDVCRRAVELAAQDRRCASMNDITEVVKAMQGSATALWMKGCSLHERLVLAAIVRVVKNEGVEEVPWAEVRRQHALYVDALIADNEPAYKPSAGELGIVLDGLLATRAVLLEDEAPGGVFRAMGERRVVLNIEQGEVERVLGDVGGQRWKNALGG